MKWLCGLVLGSVGLRLPEHQRDFLDTQVALYLDQFIDGDVPLPYERRCCGNFMDRLRAAWAASPHAQEEFSIPSDQALAGYVRHAIRKMNANFGFGPHTPGLGRSHVSAKMQDEHFKLLGESVVQTIARDFKDDERSIAALPSLQPSLIIELAQTHLHGMYLYQAELGNALQGANRDGEEARRRERLRIWGYA